MLGGDPRWLFTTSKCEMATRMHKSGLERTDDKKSWTTRKMAFSKFLRERHSVVSFVFLTAIKTRRETMEVKMSWEEGVVGLVPVFHTVWPLYQVRLASANGWTCLVVFCIWRCYFAATGCSLWSFGHPRPLCGRQPICPLWPLAWRRDFTPLTGCFLLLGLFSVNLDGCA